jgi:hypothetical protein
MELRAADHGCAVDTRAEVRRESDGGLVVSMVVPMPRHPWNSNERGGWRARKQREVTLRRQILSVAHANRMSLGFPPASMPRVLRAFLIRGYGQGSLDTEQRYTALKPVVDALKNRHSGCEQAGWLVDDSRRWVDYASEEEVDRDLGPAVRLTIRVSAAEVATWPAGGP